MAINNVNNLNNQQVNTQKSEQQSQVKESVTQRAAVQQAASPRADSVSLTPQAQQMSRLTKKAEGTTGIDEDKVAQVKKAISEGKYQINAERLASKIATMEKDLFER